MKCSLLNRSTWTTQEGIILHPLKNQIEKSHLENIMRMLQKPQTLQRMQEIALLEYHSLPTPNGDIAADCYDNELIAMSDRLNDMTPKEYFDQYVKTSMLWKSLAYSYLHHYGETKIPTPRLTDEEQTWFRIGYKGKPKR